MTGKEELKVGDKMICTSNEGLSTVGSKYEITALQGNFFSRTKNGRIWENRGTFRWSCYKHLPQAIVPTESAQASAGGRIRGSHE
jgi:hypothetical protein